MDREHAKDGITGILPQLHDSIKRQRGNKDLAKRPDATRNSAELRSGLGYRYLMSCGTGSENVDAALQLLNGSSKPARVLMAQVRQPFSNRNGQEPRGRKNIDDMNVNELRQECYENRNTIQQMKRTAEPYKRQRQNNWQGRRGADQQPAPNSQPGTKPGVHVPEGTGKDHKAPPKSPAKAQARMLSTSWMTSDSDENVVYERANLVRRRREESKMDTGTSVVHEEDSPFSLDQIRTSICDSEPGRERANLVRVKLEPGMEVEKPGLDLPDPINTNVESEKHESEKRIDHAKKIMEPSGNMEILGQREFQNAKFGTAPATSARLIWRQNGSMYTPEGIPYIPEPDEVQLAADAQMPEIMEKEIVPPHRKWQRGCRPMTIREEHKVIQSSVHGNCVVIHGYMYPLPDFLRGPLCKPSLEVEQRSACSSLFDPHDT